MQICLVDNDQTDRGAQQRAQLVAGADVGRVGDRDEQAAVLEKADRDRVVVARDLRRQPFDGGRVDLGRVEVDELQLVLLGQRPRDRVRGHPAPLHKQLAEAQAGAMLVDQSKLELLVRDQSLADEKRSQREPVSLLGGQHLLLYRRSGHAPEAH